MLKQSTINRRTSAKTCSNWQFIFQCVFKGSLSILFGSCNGNANKHTFSFSFSRVKVLFSQRESYQFLGSSAVISFLILFLIRVVSLNLVRGKLISSHFSSWKLASFKTSHRLSKHIHILPEGSNVTLHRADLVLPLTSVCF